MIWIRFIYAMVIVLAYIIYAIVLVYYYIYGDRNFEEYFRVKSRVNNVIGVNQLL